MKIVVYGPGCARCHETERVVRHVVEQLDVSADVEKVSDYQAMAAAGVVATPAVSIDGVMKLSGRIPKAEEVKGWLAALPDRPGGFLRMNPFLSKGGALMSRSSSRHGGGWPGRHDHARRLERANRPALHVVVQRQRPRESLNRLKAEFPSVVVTPGQPRSGEAGRRALRPAPACLRSRAGGDQGEPLA